MKINDTKHVVFENSGLNKAVGSRRSHALIILSMRSIFVIVFFLYVMIILGLLFAPKGEHFDLRKMF